MAIVHSGGTALGTEGKTFMELIPRLSVRNHCRPSEDLLQASTEMDKTHLPKIIQIDPSKRSLNQNLKRMGYSWEDLSLGSHPGGSAATSL